MINVDDQNRNNDNNGSRIQFDNYNCLNVYE